MSDSPFYFILPSLLQDILPFLSVKEAIRFDSAVTDKSYREEVSKQITNYVNSFMAEVPTSLKEIEWLVRRKAIITRARFGGPFHKPELLAKVARSLSLCNDTLTELSFYTKESKEAMSICPSLPNLERFELYTQQIPANLRLFWSQHKTLKHVNLTGDIYRGPDLIITLAQNCYQLISFELYSVIYDRDIDALATHCPMLERLHLGSKAEVAPQKELSKDTLIKLATKCIYLKEVGFYNFKYFTDILVDAFIPYMHNLLHLELTSSYQISDASVASIVTHCHQLQSFDITWCPLVSKSGYLQLKLIPTLTSITMLDLSGTEHTINPHTDDTGFANLLEVVKDANQLIDEYYFDADYGYAYDENIGHNYDPYDNVMKNYGVFALHDNYLYDNDGNYYTDDEEGEEDVGDEPDEEEEVEGEHIQKGD